MMSVDLKSPLRYPNGKKRFALDIVSRFPNGVKEVRDVMSRAGNISFTAKNIHPSLKIWMNDINADLVNFFKYASYYNKEMVDLVVRWRSEFTGDNGKDLFRYCHDVLHKERNKPFDRNYLYMATAFYIINRLAYSGTLNGGFTEYNYKYRMTRSNLDVLRTLDGFLSSNWMLTNVDYKSIIKAPRSSKIKRNKDILLYINPPYWNDDMQMYHNSISEGNRFNYKELADLLAQTKYNFMVTVDDSSYIRSLFGFANIVSLSTLNGGNPEKSNNVIPKDLLFISNY